MADTLHFPAGTEGLVHFYGAGGVATRPAAGKVRVPPRCDVTLELTHLPSDVRAIVESSTPVSRMQLHSVTSGHLRQLGTFRLPRGLGLEGDFTDADLTHLADVGTIKILGLNSPHLTGSGLRNLARLDIETLMLTGPLGSELWQSLKSHSQLQGVTIWSATLNADGIETMARLPNLQYIAWTGGSITAAAVSSLSRLPTHIALSLHSDDLASITVDQASRLCRGRKGVILATATRGQSALSPLDLDAVRRMHPETKINDWSD